MPITNAPFYPLAGFWLDKTRVEAVYDVDGQTYHLRQLGRNVYYHREGADTIEQTCFVCCDSALGRADWPSKSKAESANQSPDFNANRGVDQERIYPQSVFAAQIRAGDCGRYALYSSPTYRDADVIMLLRQDGTGTCLHEPQALTQEACEPEYRTDFHWDGSAYGILRSADILNASWQRVAALCEDVLQNQVLPRMTDPFVRYDQTPDELFGYICGSEKELAQVTRYILHIHPALFEVKRGRRKQDGLERNQKHLTVTYRATTLPEAGGPKVKLKNPCLRLLELAFEHNTFRGGVWMRRHNGELSRRLNYQMRPYTQDFHIAPPSAHEQAESLLLLYDWLENKVSEKERRRLLRLDAPTTPKSKQT